jgi:hypothetical protein
MMAGMTMVRRFFPVVPLLMGLVCVTMFLQMKHIISRDWAIAILLVIILAYGIRMLGAGIKR